MTGPDVLVAVQLTCEQIASRRGLEVVEVRFETASGRRVLAVSLDRPDGGLSLDEIAEVSEEISRALDIDDPIVGAYVLEVSSAGIERPLVKPADYQRFRGREITVRCTRPVEGQKNFRGPLTSAGDTSFVVKDEGGTVVEIPYSDVARTKLFVDWDAELRKGN